jgi:murein L,D-transpeptidase YafK
MIDFRQGLGTGALQHLHQLAFRRRDRRPVAFKLFGFSRQVLGRFALSRLLRLSAAPAAVALATALGGCQTDDLAVGARALKPLPPELAAEVDKRNMPRESPILVRIFKEESELEVWKQTAEGRFALLKTYPICRWSGELGPKVKMGDRQAPEGFYTITPGQMNPNSNYYLAFNLGFPNAYDRANDRSGDFLMVHGDCSSAGCYAMTDEQIQEIYALGRDSFLGGQKSFQVQAYPFRMTAVNLAKHRDNPNMPFWRMIKEGNDHFEVTKAEPRIEVCDKHYVFNPRTPASAFHPREACPAYDVLPDIALSVKAKEAADDHAVADLVHRGTSTVAVRTGADGGMHPVFLAKLQGRPSLDFTSDVKAPSGTLPAHVVPPRAPDQPLLSFSAPSWMTSSPPAEPVPAAPAANATPAASTNSASGGSLLGRWLGFGGGETAAPAPAPAPAAAPAATSKPKPAAKPAVATAANKPKTDGKPTETAQVPSSSPSVR